MAWLQLTVTVNRAEQAAVDAALQACGALSLTLLDADLDTPDEQAVFEPGVGETPLWPRTRMQALFAHDVDKTALLLQLSQQVPDLRPGDMQFTTVADQDWERVWMDRFKPMAFGRRLWVYPWTIEPPDTAEQTVVRLDPGLAFGSGTHATTALCLEWLDGLALHDAYVMDYGCGSGVLAIAALKLGAARALGVDNDPQALLAANSNATRNQVDARFAACLPDAVAPQPADVFVANILAAPLTALAPTFARLCKPHAPFALSGILEGQQQALLDVYAAWFDQLQVSRKDGWIRISGRRKHTSGAHAA